MIFQKQYSMFPIPWKNLQEFWVHFFSFIERDKYNARLSSQSMQKRKKNPFLQLKLLVLLAEK